MNTKTVLASTLLSALLAGTSAVAGQNDHFAAADYATDDNNVVVMQKVSFQAPSVAYANDNVSGQK